MQRNGHSRRVLLVGDIHSFSHLRQQYTCLSAEHGTLVAELTDLQRQVGELRSIFGDVVGALRAQADTDVAKLRHQLELAIAQLERDPNCPLN